MKKHRVLILGALLIVFGFLLDNVFLWLGWYQLWRLSVLLCRIGFLLVIILFLIKSINKHIENNKHYYRSFTIISIIYSLVFAVSPVLIPYIDEVEKGILSIISLLFSKLFISLYFLPYLTANKKNHLQTRAIYILNIVAGWTILAWILALIWANTESKAQTALQSNADELRKFKDLLNNGVITQEEFDAKKKQLLGI